MKPIAELPGAREISPRTRLEVQHYTALHTIANAIAHVSIQRVDAFDVDLLEATRGAMADISAAEDLPIRGALAGRLEALGYLKKYTRAQTARRRASHSVASSVLPSSPTQESI